MGISSASLRGLFNAVLALSAVICVSYPGAANAQAASGNMTVGQLTYTLTDLDPSDGIPPSLEYKPMYMPPPGEYNLANLTAYRYDGGNYPRVRLYPTGTDDLVGAFEDEGKLGWSGTMSGRESPATHMIELEVYAASDGSISRSAFVQILSGNFPFTLSPKTAVTFSLEFTTNGRIFITAEQDQLFSSRVIMFSAIGDFEPYLDSDGADEIYSLHPFFPERALDVSGILHTTVQNISSEPANGITLIAGNASAFAGQPFLAIPEPAIWPMLAAGLLLIRLRRHRH